jgi:hypothetical protein
MPLLGINRYFYKRILAIGLFLANSAVQKNFRNYDKK